MLKNAYTCDLYSCQTAFWPERHTYMWPLLLPNCFLTWKACTHMTFIAMKLLSDLKSMHIHEQQNSWEWLECPESRCFVFCCQLITPAVMGGGGGGRETPVKKNFDNINLSQKQSEFRNCPIRCLSIFKFSQDRRLLGSYFEQLTQSLHMCVCFTVSYVKADAIKELFKKFQPPCCEGVYVYCWVFWRYH